MKIASLSIIMNLSILKKCFICFKTLDYYVKNNEKAYQQVVAVFR